MRHIFLIEQIYLLALQVALIVHQRGQIFIYNYFIYLPAYLGKTQRKCFAPILDRQSNWLNCSKSAKQQSNLWIQSVFVCGYVSE